MLSFRSKRLSAMRLTQFALCVSSVFVFEDAMAGIVTVCNDSGVAGTLRSVVAAAASAEPISVSNCSSITLTNGEIASSLSRLRITGSTAAPTIISGNHASRVINHTGSGGYLLLSGVTIQDGNNVAATALGGCIYSAAPIVNLDHMTIKNCAATETSAAGLAEGGGLFAKHFVHMVSSVITGNSVTQQSASYFKAAGGGIYADSMAVYNSTISLNSAGSTGGGTTAKYTLAGGAVAHYGAKIYSSTVASNAAGKYGGLMLDKGASGGVNIANSTISGNGALHRTGGIHVGPVPFTLANSTVAFNTSFDAQDPAGVYASGATTLLSSIIANNTFNNGNASDLFISAPGSIAAASANNIIRTANIATPADTIHADPRLLPLGDNGGVTQTHALQQGSPALNRGNNLFEFANFTPLTCDQRGNPGKPQSNPPNTDHCDTVNGGFLRVDADVQHMLPDVGAYEEQLPNPDWIFSDGFDGNFL